MVLKGNVEEILKQILQKIYYHIKALVVMPDHVHVFVDVPQTAAPCDVVRTFKDISAIELFKAFPQLI
ncbi:transposase [Catenibacterium mitsuokai]|nr:transposase [Catenibacterium mitsuokai]